ncbi:MAG TPA: hypothetical protein VNL98_04785 [Gemmatimonadales bacterium]|nr:hypothetical protein [Gemmatimonadales bacterium]
MGILVMAENLFSGGVGGQYPGHTITAEEEPSGNEAYRVATARRAGTNKATATTANSPWWVRSVFDRVRAHNCCILDRGHNLGGKTLELRTTLDATDFTGTFETAFDITLPSISMPGGIDNGLGVVTEEGAWIKRYGTRTGKAIELFIDAMGANLKPEIVGLYVGLAVEFDYFEEPGADETFELLSLVVHTESGWIGRGRRTKRRRGEFRIKLTTQAEYEEDARLQVMGLFADGVPMWIVPNTNDASRAFLAVVPPEAIVAATFPPEWPAREVVIPFVEHEPRSY